MLLLAVDTWPMSLVRKLFQPEELSTVMHKDKTVTLHQKQTLQQV